MKAAVVHEFGAPLVVEEVPRPEPGPGQVLVRVEAAGLCHTDIHAARGDWPVKATLPLIPGHEGVGVVEAVGSTEVEGIAVGTHQDLTEVFALHRLGRTRVLAERRSLEQVNEAFEEVLDGSAAAPRLVFGF